MRGMHLLFRTCRVGEFVSTAQCSPPRAVLPHRSLRFANRPYVAMEDAHATVLELDVREKNAFFAVYDGHGGELHRQKPDSLR